jgi:ketosteroid isomerase-like protein
MSLSVEDRLDIHDLYARYAYAFDAGDGDAWAGLFTANGRFLREGEPDLVGRPVLRQFALDRNAAAPGVSHHTTSITVEGDGDAAHGAAYVLVLRVSDGELRLRNMGTYTDEIRRVGDQWQFARRVYRTWLSPEMVDAEFALGISVR